MAARERRLVHIELVGFDRTLNDVLAESPRGGDEHDVAKAGLGVQREDHAAGAQIGADHPLDADRQRDVEVVEAVVDAVLHRAIGEQTGEAAATGLDECGLAADVEETLVLTREARLRQIFRRRRAANRNGNVGTLFCDETFVCGDDFGAQIVGQLGFVDQLATLPRAVHQTFGVVRLNTVEQFVQASSRGHRG